MTPELIYILKVNIGITLFYAFYKLFCRHDTFFQWRRITLLGFLALSFLYPLLNIQTWVKEQPAVNELADYYAVLTNTTFPYEAATPAEATTLPPVPDMLTWLGPVYICGIILFSLRFIIQLSGVFRMIQRSRKVIIDNICVRSLPSPVSPFSFWQWIFIYLPGLEKEKRQEILTHELTHVRQWHSIDVLLSETANIICWMNPFMWLLKAEIRLNLEYLADHKVTETITDIRRYQYHLLGLANQNRQTGLYNNFNLSHLKNRIIMMNQKRTRTTGRIKYALFALLAAALLLVSNIEALARTAEKLAAPAADTNSPATVKENPSIRQEKNPVTTFLVTIVDKQGKTVPNANIQTKLNGELLNFTTGENGKAEVKLAMGNLKNAYMHASTPDGKSYFFLLVPNSTEVTVNIDKKQPAPPSSGPDENGLYTIVEEMPEFPGNMQECTNFISKNIRYPAEAKQKGIHGRVIIQVIVEADGTLSHPKVVRSVEPSLDAEAIRVIESMPTWKPGFMKGKAVRCKYTLPVTFSLQ